MRISDWSSDVCSSDLMAGAGARQHVADLGTAEARIDMNRRCRESRQRENAGQVIDPIGLPERDGNAGRNATLGQIAREPFDPTCEKSPGQALIAIVDDRKSTRLNSSH